MTGRCLVIAGALLLGFAVAALWRGDYVTAAIGAGTVLVAMQWLEHTRQKGM